MGQPSDKFIDLLKQAQPLLHAIPLTDQHRAILTAVYPEDGTRLKEYAAVAEELQIPVGTVRSRLSRARAVIAKFMQAHADPRLGEIAGARPTASTEF